MFQGGRLSVGRKKKKKRLTDRWVTVFSCFSFDDYVPLSIVLLSTSIYPFFSLSLLLYFFIRKTREECFRPFLRLGLSCRVSLQDRQGCDFIRGHELLIRAGARYPKYPSPSLLLNDPSPNNSKRHPIPALPSSSSSSR